MGVSAVRVLVRGGDPALRRTLTGPGLLSAALVLFALGLLGWAQLAAFRDPFVPWTEDAALLLGTSWGTRWIGAVALAAVAIMVAALHRMATALLPVSVVLAAYPSLSGHAAAVEPWTAAAVVSDWIHVLAAGAWMGALGVLLLAGRGADPAASPLVRHLHSFSLLARASVAALVLTGAVASWLHLPGPAALWHHPYGRILALKLGLVVLIMGMGARNWRVLSPEAQHPEGAARLLRASRAEAALGFVVIVVTAWLTGTAPPA